MGFNYFCLISFENRELIPEEYNDDLEKFFAPIVKKYNELYEKYEVRGAKNEKENEEKHGPRDVRYRKCCILPRIGVDDRDAWAYTDGDLSTLDLSGLKEFSSSFPKYMFGFYVFYCDGYEMTKFAVKNGDLKICFSRKYDEYDKDGISFHPSVDNTSVKNGISIFFNEDYGIEPGW
jgi:hypothetical protein